MSTEKKNTETVIDEAEFAAAEAEAAVSADVYTHTFEPPVQWEGKTYDELVFDFGKMTGEDDLAIENELAALGKPVITAEFSGDYLIRMAARSCTEKIGVDMLKKLPMKDFRKIRNKARSFLLRSGS